MLPIAATKAVAGPLAIAAASLLGAGHNHATTEQHVQHHAQSGKTVAAAKSYNSPAGTMYDSTTPSSIPSKATAIATYANGPYAQSSSAVAGHRVIWIDTNGSDPRANALDVEPGDATPGQVAGWVSQHVADTHSPAIIYTYQSGWSAAIQSVSSLPHADQKVTKYWIADPTSSPHSIRGASAVQFLWNGDSFDENTTVAGFLNGVQVAH